MIDHAKDSNGSNNEFDLSDHDMVEKSMQSSVTKLSYQQDQFRQQANLKRNYKEDDFKEELSSDFDQTSPFSR